MLVSVSQVCFLMQDIKQLVVTTEQSAFHSPNSLLHVNGYFTIHCSRLTEHYNRQKQQTLLLGRRMKHNGCLVHVHYRRVRTNKDR